MTPGDHAELRRRFEEPDLAALAALAGGHVHGGTVPRALIAAMISRLLGVDLPGPGTNYLKQSLRFHAEAPLGTPLVARVEITRLRPEKRLVDLRATCVTEAGALICDGRALVLVPGLAEPGRLPPLHAD
ncbi:MAG: hypothetical protein Kow0013_28180 [Pararhodobacter sp.]